MTPIHTLTLTANANVSAVIEALYDVGHHNTATLLSRYSNGLAECVSTEPVTVELYDERDLDADGYLTDHGVRVIWLADVGRAAVGDRHENYFLWTDACSPEDAARRFRDDEMSN